MNPSTLPPSANFSDALRQLGHPFQTLRGEFRCPFSPVRLSGPAYPVRCYAGATWALEEAIEAAPPGSVLVVDGGGFPDAVLMGGLMSLRANQRGIAGAVIDGAIRDISELIAAQWPVFAVARTPSGGIHAQTGDWNRPVTCGGVAIAPGDFIVADDDGVVAVPAALLAEVEERARLIEAKEQFIEKELRRGRSLGEAVALWQEQAAAPQAALH